MKKIIYPALFVSLFCSASFALADSVTIPNPLGDATGDFTTLLSNIGGAVGVFIASLGAIMIIVAGILYLTSAGSPDKVGLAKKALVYAIIGIVIGLIAKPLVDIIVCIIKGGASC